MISRISSHPSNRPSGITLCSSLALTLLLATAIARPEGALGADAPLTISGTVTYTGSQGPVSAAKPIVLFATTSRVLDGIPVAVGVVDVNGGTFELTVPAPGDYYLAYVLDTNGDALPGIGDPFGIYDNRLQAPGDPITVPVSGTQSNLVLTFGDTAGLPGVYGTVTYTGNLGPVDETRPIRVQVFREADLTDRVDRQQRLTTNGGSYEFLLPEERLFYMQVFLDLNDNDVRDPGEPFEIYPDRYSLPGDPLPEGIAEVNVVFGDGPDPTPTPQEDLVVSGTIEYTGSLGPVSTERPIFIFLFSNPLLDGAPVRGFMVTQNGGTFAMGAPGPGEYYLAYLLDTNGDGQPAVGDPYEVYQDRVAPPGDAVTVPQTGLVLSFGDTGGLPGVRGTVTYTGDQGSVSFDTPIQVDVYRDAQLTDRLDQSQQLVNNGDPYQFILFEDTSHYLVAFLDLNKNESRDSGEPFTIYNGKTSIPGDPLPQQGGAIVDITFGDVPAEETPTPTATETPPLPTPTGTPPAIACVGACNGSSEVTSTDLVLGVDIALGGADPSECPEFDADGSQTVTVDEVVQGVDNAINQCSANT
jgi:hypothetical protein